MLKNIDPILAPNLLRALRAMGHGDEIAIVDANFPAASNAKRLIRLDGISAPRALDAILSVMPLDDVVDHAAFRMDVIGDAKAEVPIYGEFRTTLAKHETGKTAALGALSRQTFYARAKNAFAIVATTETRLYGNILLVKGVVRPA
jgi:L-fucose mutarotase